MASSKSANKQPAQGSVRWLVDRLALATRRPGHAFLRVVFDTDAARVAVMNQLRQELATDGLTVAELRMPTGLEPLQVAQWLRDEVRKSTADVVSIVGFESAYLGENVRTQLPPLNAQRENLVAVRRPLIWWMTDGFATAFVQAAPDLDSFFMTRLVLTEVLPSEPVDSRETEARLPQRSLTDLAQARSLSADLSQRLEQTLAQPTGSLDEWTQLAQAAVKPLHDAGAQDEANQLANRLATLIGKASRTTEPKFDFFISYTRNDAQWAAWIAWELEAAGFKTFLQAWDFRPGVNITLNMQKGAAESRQTIAVLSPDYLKSDFCAAEWAAAFFADPTSKQSKLLAVRVKPCEPEGLLQPIAYIDLVGTDEVTAKDRLLAGVKKERAKPTQKPSFPGSTTGASSEPRQAADKPPFPAAIAAIWNITKRRNQHFMFREAELKQLDQALKRSEIAALTQAITGLGGVGKTQLAVEFAYRHASTFSIVWWIRSEEPSTLMADLAALAGPLGLPEADVADLRISVAAVKRALAQRGDWLLIFDNVTDPQTVQDYLPSSPTGRKASKHAGRVLLTSRNAKVASLGQTVEVRLFSREDAASFLLERCSPATRLKTATAGTEREAALELAEVLGDLPLALAQAAAFMANTQTSIAEYLKLARAKLVELLKRGEAHEYPATVATTWELSFQQIESQSPAAADLLRLLSFFAPDRIPRWLLTENTALLPSPLSETVADPLAWLETIELLRSYSLIDQDENSVSVHRLVQAVSRNRLSREQQIRWASLAQKLVLKYFPVDVQTRVAAWPRCGELHDHAETLSQLADHLSADPDTTAELLNQLAVYQYVRADFNTAILNQHRSLTIDEHSYGAEHPKVAVRLTDLAQLLKATNRLVEAEQLMRRALAIEEQSYGSGHPNVARNLNNLAALLQATNHLAEAEALMRRALTIDELSYGAEHPDVARDLNNLGWLLKETNRLMEAEPLMRRALAIDEHFYGVEHPKVAIRLNNLAQLLQDTIRSTEAEPLMRRALVIDEQSYGAEHPKVAIRLNNLAQLLKTTNRLAEAEPLMRRALAIDEQFYRATHPNVAIRLNNLARLLQQKAESHDAKRRSTLLAEAEPLMRRALEIFRTSLGDEHPNTLTVAKNYERLQAAIRDAGHEARE